MERGGGIRWEKGREKERKRVPWQSKSSKEFIKDLDPVPYQVPSPYFFDVFQIMITYKILQNNKLLIINIYYSLLLIMLYTLKKKVNTANKTGRSI